MNNLVEARSLQLNSTKIIKKHDLPGYIDTKVPGVKPKLFKPYTGLFLPSEGVNAIRSHFYQTFPIIENFREWPIDHVTLLAYKPLDGNNFLRVYDAVLTVEQEGILDDFKLRFKNPRLLEDGRTGDQVHLYLAVDNTEPLVAARARLTSLLAPQGLVLDQGFNEQIYHVTLGSPLEGKVWTQSQIEKFNSIIEGTEPIDESVPYYLGIKGGRKIKINGVSSRSAVEIFTPASTT